MLQYIEDYLIHGDVAKKLKDVGTVGVGFVDLFELKKFYLKN